jgi:hypothetical protein
MQIMGCQAESFAILVPSKEAYGYLEAHGVQILHGMASDSRCLSRVERSNASLMRKVVKLSASLKLPIKAVLSQAVINHNLQPSDVLGGHWPAEMYYTRPRGLLASIFRPIPTPKTRGTLKTMHEQELATTLMEKDSIDEAV